MRGELQFGKRFTAKAVICTLIIVAFALAGAFLGFSPSRGSFVFINDVLLAIPILAIAIFTYIVGIRYLLLLKKATDESEKVRHYGLFLKKVPNL